MRLPSTHLTSQARRVGWVGDGQPRVCVVYGRSELTTRTNALPGPHAQLKTRTKLQGRYKGRDAPFRLNMASSTPPTPEEYTRWVQDNQAAGQAVPSLVDAARVLQRRKQALAEVCTPISCVPYLMDGVEFFV